jgi:hypothetical protein
MECPNAKGHMMYPGDFGVEFLNSLTRIIWSYLKLSRAIWSYLELSAAI